jgi:hypothetical protein
MGGANLRQRRADGARTTSGSHRAGLHPRRQPSGAAKHEFPPPDVEPLAEGSQLTTVQMCMITGKVMTRGGI